MMIATFLFALQAAPQIAGSPVPGAPLAAIGQQKLPAKGCAAYLWTVGSEHALVVMASAEPGRMRIAVDGPPRDYALAAQQGVGGLGFAGTTTYRDRDITLTLDMQIQTMADLADGAHVPSATLRLQRPEGDEIIIPLGGLIGCAR